MRENLREINHLISNSMEILFAICNNSLYMPKNGAKFDVLFIFYFII